MANEQFTEGREEGFAITKAILEDRRKHYDALDISTWNSHKEAPAPAEETAYLRQNIQNFFDILDSDLKSLEEGKTTQDIRGIESLIKDGETASEGTLSAIRDSYDLLQALTPESIITAPLPENTNSTSKQQSLAGMQMEILGVIRADLSKKLEMEGRKLSPGAPPTTLPVRREALHPAFNEISITEKSALNIEVIKQFEDEKVVTIKTLESAEEQQRYQTLNDALIVFEHYKASLTPVKFNDIAPSSEHQIFCQNHSYAVMETVRNALLSMIKGAKPEDICPAIEADDETTGRDKALKDIAIILQSLDPQSIAIDHSAGYKISYGENTARSFSQKTSDRSLRDLFTLLQKVAYTENLEQFLQSGAIAAITRPRKDPNGGGGISRATPFPRPH